MRIFTLTILLVLSLAASVMAEQYVYKSISIRPIGAASSPDEWSKKKDEALAKLQTYGDVVEITETPYTIDGTTSLFTYTAKIRKP